MSSSEELDKLLLEAELAVQQHRAKLQNSNDNSFHKVIGNTSYNISQTNHSQISNGLDINISTIFNETNENEKLRLQHDIPQISLQGCRLGDDNDVAGNTTAAVSDLPRTSSVIGNFDKTGTAAQTVLDELRELCWLLLSTASTALRDCARANRQLTGRRGGAEQDSSTEETATQQQQVAQAAARIQHLLVEVCVVQQGASDSEAECGRLCSYLNDLLRQVSSALTTAGLQHLAESPTISPRRTNVQRQVEAACSSLQLLQQEVQRCRQRQEQEQQRGLQLQQHVQEAEERAQEATKFDMASKAEERDREQQRQQLLQQVYLELARAEEQLKQAQLEWSTEMTASKEQGEEQQGTIAQLRQDLAQCQYRLCQSADTTRELSVNYDHLKDEFAVRTGELEGRVEAAVAEREQEQTAADGSERQARTTVLLAKQERDDAVTRAVLLQGDLDGATKLSSKLQEQLKERLDMQEEISSSMLEVQDRFTDCKNIHDHEIKLLHDKLSAQGTALCEAQQRLRRQELSALQQRTQLQLETQRAQDLKDHTTDLVKQIDNLNKTLQDQLNRKVCDDFSKVLKSLTHTEKGVEEMSCTKLHYELDPLPSRPSPAAGVEGRDQRSHSHDGRPQPSTAGVRPTNSTQSLYSNTPDSSRPLCSAGRRDHRDNSSVNSAVPLDLTRQMACLEVIEKNMLDFPASDNFSRQQEEKDACTVRNNDECFTSRSAAIQPMDLSNGSTHRFNNRATDWSETRFSRPVDGAVDLSTTGSRYNAASLNISRRVDQLTLNSTRYSDNQAGSSLSVLNSRNSPVHSTRLTSSDSPINYSTRPGLLPSASYSASFALDSGISSEFAASSSGSETRGDSSEVRRVRAEARKERVEAAKLREKCALLQVELNSQKNALDDERARVRTKSRINRVKRGEFCQLLGSLEESFERTGSSSLAQEDLLHHTTFMDTPADGAVPRNLSTSSGACDGAGGYCDRPAAAAAASDGSAGAASAACETQASHQD